MTTILTIIHVLVSLFLIAIVLLQQGKGADMGATFGGGSSQTVFGADGPVSLLSKITTAAAVIFMVTSLVLAYQTAHNNDGSVMTEISVPNETKDDIEPKPQLIETLVEQPAEEVPPVQPVTPAPKAATPEPAAAPPAATTQETKTE